MFRCSRGHSLHATATPNWLARFHATREAGESRILRPRLRNPAWPSRVARKRGTIGARGVLARAPGGPMSLSSRLSPHLPFIRRYARALTGDQAIGDAYVRASSRPWRPDRSSMRDPVAQGGALPAVPCCLGNQWRAVGAQVGRRPGRHRRRPADAHLAQVAAGVLADRPGRLHTRSRRRTRGTAGSILPKGCTQSTPPYVPEAA